MVARHDVIERHKDDRDQIDKERNGTDDVVQLI